MTVKHIVEMSCDQPDCDVAYAPDVVEMTSVQATRTGSYRAGWSRSEGKDFCPTHSSNDQAILVGLIRGLAAKHKNDSEIGAGLGMTHDQVQRLRRTHGIPSGVRPGRPANRMEACR